MATLVKAAVKPMKAAQVPKPGADFGSGANSKSSSIQSVLHIRLRRIHVRQPEQLARSPVSLPWIRPACPFCTAPF